MSPLLLPYRVNRADLKCEAGSVGVQFLSRPASELSDRGTFSLCGVLLVSAAPAAGAAYFVAVST